jgi:ubiquinone/menaquinone biosynthesis C-methylase UbiE
MRRMGEARVGESIEWLAGRAESLPVTDESFDVVLLMTVLEFVDDPARTMAEAWRVVRSGAAGALAVLRWRKRS